MHPHLAAGGGHRRHIGPGLDLVGDDGVAAAVEPGHAGDLDGVRPRAADVRAHGVQEVGKVHDVGLLGDILDDGGALRQGGGHHDIHGGAHGDHIQIYVGAVETAALRRGVDEAALQRDLGAHGGEALHVLVDGPDAAEVAAAGHGHLRLAEAAQQGTHEVVGGPDPPRQVIGGAGAGDVTAVDLHRVGVEEADAGAQLLQDLQAQGHVRDHGDVLNAADAVHHQGGGNDGHGGVLGAADGDLAEKRLAAAYQILSCQSPEPLFSLGSAGGRRLPQRPASVRGIQAQFSPAPPPSCGKCGGKQMILLTA